MAAACLVARVLWHFQYLALLCNFLGATGEDVLTLTGDTFAATVEAAPLILVKFYAPWCGHCRRVAPDYEQAAGILKGRVPLAKVDATVEATLAEQYKIEGYPTFYLFRRGVPEEYTGGRQASGFVQWMEEQMGPAVTTLASDTDLQAQLGQRGSKLFFVGRGDKALLDIFKELAEEHRSLGSFFYVETQEAALVEIHRGADEVVQISAPDAMDSAKVLDFINAEMLPAFGEIGEDNYEPYLRKSGQGIVWACFQPDTLREDVIRHTPAFREVAAAIPHLPVVYTDTQEYEEHVKEELGCTSFPMLVVQLGNMTAGEEAKRYRKLLLEEEMNGQALTAWVQSVLAGQVEEDDGLDELDEPDEDDLVDEEGADGASGGGSEGTAAKTEL